MSEANSHFAHLDRPIEYDPYYILQYDAVKTARNHYGNAITSSGDLVHEAVYGSSLLNEIYRKVADQYGPAKLGDFKTTIARNLNCGNAVTKAITPIKFKKVRHTCGGKGCLDCCAPYKAGQVVKYHNNCIRMVVCDDYDIALKTMLEIKDMFENVLEFDHMTVILTPGHDGRNYIRIGTLRLNELGPLQGENEVSEAVATFDECFPEFEEINLISNEHDMVSVYETVSNGIKFTATDLYLTRAEGRGQNRERGTIKGREFNAETGEIMYISDEERKKKEDKEKGVIGKEDVIVVGSNIDEKVFKSAITKTARRISSHRDKMVFAAESPGDVLYNNSRLMKIVSEELSEMGHTQPIMFESSQITQKDVDEFMSICVPNIGIPSNVLDIDFNDDMMGLNRKSYGLKDLVRTRSNQRLATARDTILNAPTIEEYVNMVMEQIYKKS